MSNFENPRKVLRNFLLFFVETEKRGYNYYFGTVCIYGDKTRRLTCFTLFQ
uniref:Uncharacterized protein n=1 Tax=viral metagenome TaxID=1070528 RepID=A0A6C0E7P9_9ZZZZ